MKHIKTTSQAETSMRGLYKQATDNNPITAEATHKEMLQRIIDNTRKLDLLKLDISKDIGALMGYMQGHAALKDENDQILVTWTNSAERPTVDYDGIIVEMNIPPDVIQRHTTMKPGARVFTIVD